MHGNFPGAIRLLALPIYDKEDSEEGYHVVDLTDKGVQVVRIAAKVGDKKSLIIKAGDLVKRLGHAFFNAECRWVKEDHKKGRSIAGFEITDTYPTKEFASATSGHQ